MKQLDEKMTGLNLFYHGQSGFSAGKIISDPNNILLSPITRNRIFFLLLPHSLSNMTAASIKGIQK